jgi:SAM-dependent methyltransferase
MNLTKKELLYINKSFYNNYAEDFSKSRNKVWKSFHKLKDYVDKNDSVLDIGCGNGRLASIFDKNEYLGIDFSQNLIKIAQSKYRDKKFLLKDITDNRWFDDIGRFNKIFAIAVIHHIPSYDLRLKFFQDVYKILKKKGFFIFSCWDFGYKKELTNIGDNDFLMNWKDDNNVRYVHLYSQEEIMDIIENSHFKIYDEFVMEDNHYFILN